MRRMAYFDFVFRAAGDEVIIDLARAEDEAAGAPGGVGVVEDFLEVALGEFDFAGDAVLMAQELLGDMMTSGLR